ncbi:hypothetical protein KJ554_12095, partial [bacterium]|nr:hypothetical protein [bacterium]
GLAGTAVWLVAGGALAAALFVRASSGSALAGRASVAAIYGVDLLGGCLGALLVGLYLAPLAGLTGTAAATVLVAAAAVALVGSDEHGVGL